MIDTYYHMNISLNGKLFIYFYNSVRVKKWSPVNGVMKSVNSLNIFFTTRLHVDLNVASIFNYNEDVNRSS